MRLTPSGEQSVICASHAALCAASDSRNKPEPCAASEAPIMGLVDELRTPRKTDLELANVFEYVFVETLDCELGQD